MKQTRFHPGSRRTAIAVTAMVIASGIAVLPGRVSAVTDCLDGPAKTPAWALLSDGAKSRICSGQQPADTAVRRREAVALPHQSWDAIAATAASSADVPSGHVSTAAPSAVPRLADDEKSLVLMEEIRTPARSGSRRCGSRRARPAASRRSRSRARPSRRRARSSSAARGAAGPSR